MSASAIRFKIAYQRQMLEVTMEPDALVSALKARVSELTGLDPRLQKLLYKGILKDDATLAQSQLSSNAKVVLMASSASAILSVAAPQKPPPSEDTGAANAEAKAAFFEQTEHAKVLTRGKPDWDVIEKGNPYARTALPSLGIWTVNARGLKCRLSFKSETQEMQLATAERTQKIAYASIRRIDSHDMPAEQAGGEGYCAVGIQIGPTEKSLLWFYWVPKQYVENIKEAVMGRFPDPAFLLNQILNS
ncbi:hypothetical protein BC830DRAFT_121994 [Chytriomyces sp. MP71]|nr:hypothetical protein BC830DRAFT_121994 [Chytriomyces sp. MP71]